MTEIPHAKFPDLESGQLTAWPVGPKVAIRHLGDDDSMILTYAEAIALAKWLNGWAAAGNRALRLHATAKLEADEA